MRVVQRPGILLLPEKASSVKQADHCDMFEKASKSVSSVHQLLCYVPTPCSYSSAVKTPESTEEIPDNPEPAGEGDVQM